MQTNFSLAQLADPDTKESEGILRTCVHCGFCTATCPTYVLLGDELDSPRGRIYQMKDMLEKGGPPSDSTVKHIDRCLSCLSCMTTCPSGVHYMHLVDHARTHIEENYKRPPADRAIRELLARLLPNPRLFRLALLGGALGRPFAGLLPGRIGAMMGLLPKSVPAPSHSDRPGVHPAEGPRRKRVAMLLGCAQQVLAPGINEATIRLLTRHGVEVVVSKGADCCGALTHHMGKVEMSHESAKRTIDAWTREIDGGGLDAIVINASGCGTTVKDYGHMFRDDPVWGPKAARVAALAKDVTEFLSGLGLMAPVVATGQAITYHSACSMQHGQRIKAPPRDLLAAAGFRVQEVPEAHLCCGSAGTYNMLQPELARQLRDRKVRNIESTRPDAIAAGNLGCITQIGGGTGVPILHTVELLDWATGGPLPEAVAGHPAFMVRTDPAQRAEAAE
ncbi:glycolate oxidase subunit GlcF [Azospirillum sp. RWY-5-1]|uniref:Glycolate oxidase iron-sulfur subunit n=1 Tax=Azospirillum oleiclasticum TaxID=2735135 RepID=A0ABX2TCZ9_9PROT|nr:glycolate oxidase subunit GlcF [Azospirillum oleiclasticum]NYZ14186.1 glycolate oxidase subunit GlcF [Azospirillum oleiclasticum]NYZ21670.1 glycolate oxidase subunit GlcF [Azospirillum oleiclasticum]